jgi:diphosphomevalonate decarboxylase
VLNLPTTGSLALTLADLETETTVDLDAALAADAFELGGVVQHDAPLERVQAFLDLVRARAGVTTRARVVSRNSFPTAAGLASSASGFAALATAAAAAYGLALGAAELSALARRGSGSAARSIVGGFVELARGTRTDGTDAVARELLPPAAWAVTLVVAVTSESPKTVGSRNGMAATAASSPLYAAWVASHGVDLDAARAAVRRRDLAALGEVMERNCLGMHAAMMAARPPLLYWNEATLAAMRAVWRLREAGTSAWFTIDAGPQVKALCAAGDAALVGAALASVPGVRRIVTAAPGPGARLTDGHEP